MLNVVNRNAGDVTEAAKTFNLRKSRQADPEGSYDSGRRWMPSIAEKCACCESIRLPSIKWPASLLQHCRSAAHIALLYQVDREELICEAKKLNAEAALLLVANKRA
jgi:hypothetical protein